MKLLSATLTGPECRRLSTLLVIAVVVAVLTLPLHGPVTFATDETHNPPWSDNFHFKFADGSYTIDAAEPATTQQDAVGYAADYWYNRDETFVRGKLYDDAVWSIYTHANSQSVQIYNGSSNTWFTKAEVRSYNLSGLKVAVWYGCKTAQYTTTYGDDHITRAAYVSGAGASLGFYKDVYMSGGTTAGPAYTWSEHFWYSMRYGNTIYTASKYARDKFYQERGDYGGVDAFSIWGNSSQKMTPAGYK